MRIQRVYADTSVYGGVFDPEFSAASRRFFEQVRRGRLALVASPLVRDEVLAAPAEVQEFFTELAGTMDVILVSDEAVQLQAAYLDAGAVTRRSMTDALHVALATVFGCAMIVSWNFRHIVNFQRIPMYNGVNLLHGYGTIAIYSPLEVITDEDEDV